MRRYCPKNKEHDVGVNKGDKHCWKCGTRLKVEGKICPYCEDGLEEGDKFCPSCGRPIH